MNIMTIYMYTGILRNMQFAIQAKWSDFRKF